MIDLFRIEYKLQSHCNMIGPIRQTETGRAFDEEDAHHQRVLFLSALGSNVKVTFYLLGIIHYCELIGRLSGQSCRVGLIYGKCKINNTTC